LFGGAVVISIFFPSVVLPLTPNFQSIILYSGKGLSFPGVIPDRADDVSDKDHQKPKQFLVLAFEVTHITKQKVSELREPEDSGNKGHAKLKDLVVLTVVSDIDQAKEYETLLKLNDIPAMVKENLDAQGHSKDVAIMVPEDCLDEAHVVIESQDAYDDFYDYALEDEDNFDFDPDDLDDEY